MCSGKIVQQSGVSASVHCETISITLKYVVNDSTLIDVALKLCTNVGNNMTPDNLPKYDAVKTCI